MNALRFSLHQTCVFFPREQWRQGLKPNRMRPNDFFLRFVIDGAGCTGGPGGAFFKRGMGGKDSLKIFSIFKFTWIFRRNRAEQLIWGEEMPSEKKCSSARHFRCDVGGMGAYFSIKFLFRAGPFLFAPRVSVFFAPRMGHACLVW